MHSRHPLYSRETDPFLSDRLSQALESVDWIEMTSRDSEIVIFAGDFNSEIGDLPYRVLTEFGRFENGRRVRSDAYALEANHDLLFLVGCGRSFGNVDLRRPHKLLH